MNDRRNPWTPGDVLFVTGMVVYLIVVTIGIGIGMYSMLHWFLTLWGH